MRPISLGPKMNCAAVTLLEPPESEPNQTRPIQPSKLDFVKGVRNIRDTVNLPTQIFLGSHEFR